MLLEEQCYLQVEESRDGLFKPHAYHREALRGVKHIPPYPLPQQPQHRGQPRSPRRLVSKASMGAAGATLPHFQPTPGAVLLSQTSQHQRHLLSGDLLLLEPRGLTYLVLLAFALSPGRCHLLCCPRHGCGYAQATTQWKEQSLPPTGHAELCGSCFSPSFSTAGYWDHFLALPS